MKQCLIPILEFSSEVHLKFVLQTLKHKKYMYIIFARIQLTTCKPTVRSIVAYRYCFINKIYISICWSFMKITYLSISKDFRQNLKWTPLKIFKLLNIAFIEHYIYGHVHNVVVVYIFV